MVMVMMCVCWIYIYLQDMEFVCQIVGQQVVGNVVVGVIYYLELFMFMVFLQCWQVQVVVGKDWIGFVVFEQFIGMLFDCWQYSQFIGVWNLWFRIF